MSLQYQPSVGSMCVIKSSGRRGLAVPLSSVFGTWKTVRTRIWSCLSAERPSNLIVFFLLARQQSDLTRKSFVRRKTTPLIHLVPHYVTCVKKTSSLRWRFLQESKTGHHENQLRNLARKLKHVVNVSEWWTGSMPL